MKYQALAPIYDRMMSHVEYDEWAFFIKKILKKYCPAIKPSILELGGGTALLARHLEKLDVSYLGSDFSFSMCQQARKKSFPFFCCDCRHIAVKKKFDLIIFLYDGVNYLQTLQEYAQLFNEVHLCLQDGGLFLFDITTEINSLKHFYDFLDFEDFDDSSYVRHSYYDPECCIQINDFTIFQKLKDSDLFQKFNELHIQKVFPAKSIEEQIPSSKFKILGIWDDISFRKFSPRSERIHFLIKKSG